MKRFLFILVLFLISCGNESSVDNSSVSNSVIYTSPILSGDYIEKAATSIFVESASFTDSTKSLIELQPNTSALVEAKLQPVANDKASFFEVTTMQKADFLITSSCHTSLPYGSCSTSITYNPVCSGSSLTYFKLQADKSSPKIVTVSGSSYEYADNCSIYNLDNITLTADKSYYSFSYAGESFYFTLKADKSIPKGYSYSTNGALNGFYYSYACFAEDNTCTGFAQFTGKVGRYECKGESSLSISIYADPFTTKGHTPAKITLYGAGTGRDENYPCAMK